MKKNNSIKLLFDKAWKAIYNSGFIYCLFCSVLFFAFITCVLLTFVSLIVPIVLFIRTSNMLWLLLIPIAILNGALSAWVGGSYSMCEWISVNDCLPQDGERVLVFFPSKFLPEEYCAEIMYYKRRTKAFYHFDSEYGDIECENVTYWMPIPKAPKRQRKVIENK